MNRQQWKDVLEAIGFVRLWATPSFKIVIPGRFYVCFTPIADVELE